MSSETENASKPHLLVLLATYNGAQWIRTQIESILSQVHVVVRIAIRDDGSSDGTREEISALAVRDNRIQTAHAPSPSGSAAQNFFSLMRDFDAADFDYIALADQDDAWEPDKLSRAARALSESPACCAYSSAVMAAWPNGKVRVLRQNARQTASDYLFEGAGQGCTFVLTKTFYARIRSFLISRPAETRGAHFHDWTIYALARTWRLQWCFDPHPSMQYRQHGSNDTGARLSLKGIAARSARIRNGWYRQQLLAISGICYAAAPDDQRTALWHDLLRAAPKLSRRLAMTRFCISGGRRRFADNTILIASAVLGWL